GKRRSANVRMLK
ncbi:phage terminase large subunit family protein, partial [Escherichia coli 90.0039]